MATLMEAAAFLLEYLKILLAESNFNWEFLDVLAAPRSCKRILTTDREKQTERCLRRNAASCSLSSSLFFYF